MYHVLINNGNWTEWTETWSELLHVISKARGQHDFDLKVLDRTILDQNCTTPSSDYHFITSFFKPHNSVAQIKDFSQY